MNGPRFWAGLIFDGIRILLRNPTILIPIFLALISAYFIFVVAILSVVPAEEIIELADSTQQDPEKMMHEVGSILSQDLQRTIIAAVVFGILVFVLFEFTFAGVIGMAFDANDVDGDSRVGLSSFVHYALIFTPRMILLELVISAILIAVAIPFYLLSYFSFSLTGGGTIQSFVLIFASILLFPPPFILISEGIGIFYSLKEGFRFAVYHFFDTAFIVLFSSLLVVPASFNPFLIVILTPIAFCLSAIWFTRLYLQKRSTNKERLIL